MAASSNFDLPIRHGPPGTEPVSLGNRENQQLLGSIAKNTDPKLVDKVIFSTKVNNEDYIIGKTKTGVVIQKKSDFVSGARSGIFMNAEGNLIVKPGSNNEIQALTDLKNHILSKAGELDRTLPNNASGVVFPVKANLAKMKPDDYIMVKTQKGILIQRVGDYNQSTKNGLFIPSENARDFKFDGDPECFKLIEHACTAWRTHETAKTEVSEEQPKPTSTFTAAPQRGARPLHLVLPNLPKAIYPPETPKARVPREPLYWKEVESSPPPPSPTLVASPEASVLPSGPNRQRRMEDIHAIYNRGYSPEKNKEVLKQYIGSEDYVRHAQTAKVYHAGYMDPKDAATIMHRREPVNIAQAKRYDENKLQATVGHKAGAFNDPELARLKNQPNTVCVYSQTYLWSEPGKPESRKEISCLSVPAPALDHKEQPHYNYFVKEGRLDQKKYKKEMETLAKIVVQSCLDNREAAGIERLVISRYGQGAFLALVTDPKDKEAAHKIFYETLVKEIKSHKKQLEKIEIVMADYGEENVAEMRKHFLDPLQKEKITCNLVIGDILTTAKEHDLIVNAWDPHSVPGNGNDNDLSFDGVMGKGTGISAVQSTWQNEYITPNANGLPRDPKRYVAV